MIGELATRLLGRGTAPGWLVVTLDDGTVSIAHVLPNGGRPSVEFAEEREWNPGEPKSLERVAREFRVQRFRCTTLLKPAEYQTLLVEAPAVKPDELKAAVRWRIKDMLEFHVDDATIDVLDVPVPENAGQRGHSMYAVAARSDTIRGVIERFDTAGIPLTVIDIPDTAQRNVAALYESDERGVLALAFDRDGGLITVNHGAELYLSRRLDVTFQQLAEARGEELTRRRDRVLVELQRSLDHCERTYPFFSIGRVLLGPLPDETGLREHLAANLYLPVEPLDLAATVRLPGSSSRWEPFQQAKWLKLIGAGLRVEKRTL